MRFVVVGNGNGEDALRQYASGIDSGGHQVELKGFLLAPEAREVIASEVDVMIGMGTAALDAACAGLPSIIVNPARSHKSSSECSYRWLFESKWASLGEFVEFGNSKTQVQHQLGELLDSYIVESVQITARCIEYVEQFKEHVVFKSLESKLFGSNMSLSEIARPLHRLGRLSRLLRPLQTLIRWALAGRKP